MKPPRCSTRILTNASLLTEETAWDLMESGLNSLVISIQGVRKADYEETMRGLSFEQIVENVCRFPEIRRKRGSRYPVVEVWIVETDLVRESLPEFIDHWTSLGVRVQVRRLENRTSRRYEELRSSFARGVTVGTICDNCLEENGSPGGKAASPSGDGQPSCWLPVLDTFGSFCFMPIPEKLHTLEGVCHVPAS